MNEEERKLEETFTINAKGVDVKEVIKKIRKNIASKGPNSLSEDELDELTELSFIFPPLQGEIGDELFDELTSSEGNWNLRNEQIFKEFYSDQDDWNLDPEYNASTHRKIFGIIILGVKKIIHPFIRLYTDYIVYRQARINHNFYNSIENMIRDQGRINQYLGLINHNLVKELTKTRLLCDSLEYNINQLKSEINFLKMREKALEKLIKDRN